MAKPFLIGLDIGTAFGAFLVIVTWYVAAQVQRRLWEKRRRQWQTEADTIIAAARAYAKQEGER